MDDSFYVTLPSNASLKIYENNTLTDYTTHLHDSINLEGEWMVSLAEIHYPHCWYTFTASDDDYIDVLEVIGDATAYITRSMFGCIGLQVKKFTDARHLTDVINRIIKDVFRGSGNTYPSLTYDVVTRRITLQDTIDKDEDDQPLRRTLSFSNNLQKLLGFQSLSPQPTRGNLIHVSDNVVSFRNNFDQMYIYTDIAVPSLVGDSKVPLLRLAPIKGSPGDTVSIIFDKRCYVPVVRNQLHSIQILLRNDTGAPIQFITGRVVVVLHFRRGKPLF